MVSWLYYIIGVWFIWGMVTLERISCRIAASSQVFEHVSGPALVRWRNWCNSWKTSLGISAWVSQSITLQEREQTSQVQVMANRAWPMLCLHWQYGCDLQTAHTFQTWTDDVMLSGSFFTECQGMLKNMLQYSGLFVIIYIYKVKFILERSLVTPHLSCFGLSYKWFSHILPFCFLIVFFVFCPAYICKGHLNLFFCLFCFSQGHFFLFTSEGFPVIASWRTNILCHCLQTSLNGWRKMAWLGKLNPLKKKPESKY